MYDEWGGGHKKLSPTLKKQIHNNNKISNFDITLYDLK